MNQVHVGANSLTCLPPSRLVRSTALSTSFVSSPSFPKSWARHAWHRSNRRNCRLTLVSQSALRVGAYQPRKPTACSARPFCQRHHQPVAINTITTVATPLDPTSGLFALVCTTPFDALGTNLIDCVAAPIVTASSNSNTKADIKDLQLYLVCIFTRLQIKREKY